ncbi:Predicted thiol-disulfide oxidoreductase YuxK, DCC family [Methylomagnum ishizawai]|uniref:Predicted thiol-disulfide oxidoreductase YuxK, DCC family n=1 Tax=Methylomagnum ishizawai TaxID=1760988 RepID=A0A1Y6D7U8_9GAMM|nr:DCC1-like thiol-disulfide oxidoreductase family protein [Methylomagnum ishizawai]SMF96354.1 Predicted thiol-disulfide oxidoreductase YuxK, DCC family [Methylomagnum ishizawai]
MYKTILNLVAQGLQKPVPATGLGVFRIAFSLVILQEILFLYYFRHLIFDPVPYLDRASPMLHFFLLVWLAVAGCLVLGYHTRKAAVFNYLFWVLFVCFTPMWQDFDGGFDQLMTSTSFLLIFLPSERALSLDNLRHKLRYSVPGSPYQPPTQVTVLAYYLPLGISLGLLYFDSGLHKLSSEFWRNGMGAWLPPTMPYYMSAIDMSQLLNLKGFEQLIGYAIILFQFLFLPLFWQRRFRVPLMLAGATFHAGIILSLNIYPFGFAMLVHYLLMVPFRWWREIHDKLRLAQPILTVFYDQDCPLCNRTVIVVRHFDVRGAIDFKGLQSHARQYTALDAIPDDKLLTDLYALDGQGRLFAGLDTYINILQAMGYTLPLAWLMGLPGCYGLAGQLYRKIADNRERWVCDGACTVITAPPFEDERPFSRGYARYAATERQTAQRIAKFLVLVLVLQLNSTIHYGLLYRWAQRPADPALAILDHLSDSIINYSHAFLGITPHALYMHDHFAGYNHILALSYRDASGRETWLPFVNQEGRLLAPHWGRVQSMWANVAVTSHMGRDRLEKFLRKITAYWAMELGIDLKDADFVIKLKEVQVPMAWEDDLRHKNMAAPWRDIGVVQWRGKTMRVDIPGLDIEAL